MKKDVAEFVRNVGIDHLLSHNYFAKLSFTAITESIIINNERLKNDGDTKTRRFCFIQIWENA